MAGMMMFDNAGTFNQGYANGLAGLAFNSQGDKRQGALAKLAGVDANAAFKLKAEFDDQDKADFAEFSKVMVSVPDDIKPQVYAKGVQRFGAKFSAMGFDPPQDYTQVMPLFQQAAGGGQNQEPSDVQSVKLKLQYAGYQPGTPEYKKAFDIALGFDNKASGWRTQIDNATGTMYRTNDEEVQVLQNGQWQSFGGSPQPSRQAVMDAPVNEPDDAIANQEIQRRLEAGQPVNFKVENGKVVDIPTNQPTTSAGSDNPFKRKDEQKIETWGQPFEVMQDGKPVLVERSNLGNERISKYSPKATTGAITEDMRKTSTLVERMNNSVAQIDGASKIDPSANAPGMGIVAAEWLPEFASNSLKGGQRQIVEAAQLDALDAALTLATGAAYTKEQLFGLRKSYFPQPFDKPETVKAKKARFDKLIEDAKIRAGAAAKQPSGAPTTGGALPAKNAKGWTLHTDANGNKAYVSPDGQQYEEAK